MSEMEKLHIELEKMHIPHTYNPTFDGGEQIIGYENGIRAWDAVCTKFSYGGPSGLLEIMGPSLLGCHDVEGWLTASQVIDKIKAWRA